MCGTEKQCHRLQEPPCAKSNPFLCELQGADKEAIHHNQRSYKSSMFPQQNDKLLHQGRTIQRNQREDLVVEDRYRPVDWELHVRADPRV